MSFVLANESMLESPPKRLVTLFKREFYRKAPKFEIPPFRRELPDTFRTWRIELVFMGTRSLLLDPDKTDGDWT